MNSLNDLVDLNNTTNDLWIRVITKAIDDIVFFIKGWETGRDLTMDDWNYAATAYCFLFHDGYYIPIDDYYVDVHCNKCDDIWLSKMSELTYQLDKNDQAEIECPLCKALTQWKDLKYEYSKDQNSKETNLRGILTEWGYEDIDTFRTNLMGRIKELICQK